MMSLCTKTLQGVALSALIALTSCDQWNGNTQKPIPKVTTKITELDRGPYPLDRIGGNFRHPIPVGVEVQFEIENSDDYEFQIGSNDQPWSAPGSMTRFVMPDDWVGVKFRHKKQGGYHPFSQGVFLLPVRYSDELRAEDWSIVVDRQDAARTRVKVHLILPEDSPVNPTNIYMQAFYLIYGATELTADTSNHDNAGSYTFWYPDRPSKRDEMSQEDKERFLDGHLEVLDTQYSKTDEGTEISFVVVADTAKLPLGYLCFSDTQAGKPKWNPANYIPWANLQVPITNYTDPILLFTKEFPEGAPITPEELKQLERPAAAGQPALEPVEQAALP